jgi:hypothetical protein
MIVKMYADLVEQGLRALEENEQGITLVPLKYRADVKSELDRRAMANIV